jgi:hypothetical protein
MTRPIALDTRDGGQVYNVGRVSVLTAEPNTWLFIYSGIAIQNLDAEGQGRASLLGFTVLEDVVVDSAQVRIRLDKLHRDAAAVCSDCEHGRHLPAE